MTLVCIDPGKLGGIAWAIDGKFVDCCKMPETEGDVFELLESLTYVMPCIVFIEAVHSMPKQGVKSTFTFGRGFGFLLGCLTALKYRIETVTPQKWQKALGIGKSPDKKAHKNALKAKAQQLYPGVKVTLSTADALLILEHARKMERNA